MPRTDPLRARFFRQTLLVWHRRLGLVAAALVFIVTVTGILLNHAASLKLKDQIVSNPAVLDWYGMSPAGAPIGYRAGDGWISWLGGRLFLNGRQIVERMGEIKGALELDGMLVAGSARELLLFTKQGELIERLGAASLPGPISGLGRTKHGALVLRTAAGRFQARPRLVGWVRSAEPATWVVPAKIPADVREQVVVAYRGRGLPLERVILDLHSGRIFGAWGPYAMDAAALALILLAASGVYNWVRLRRGGSRSRRRGAR